MIVTILILGCNVCSAVHCGLIDYTSPLFHVWVYNATGEARQVRGLRYSTMKVISLTSSGISFFSRLFPEVQTEHGYWSYEVKDSWGRLLIFRGWRALNFGVRILIRNHTLCVVTPLSMMLHSQTLKFLKLCRPALERHARGSVIALTLDHMRRFNFLRVRVCLRIIIL